MSLFPEERSDEAIPATRVVKIVGFRRGAGERERGELDPGGVDVRRRISSGWIPGRQGGGVVRRGVAAGSGGGVVGVGVEAETWAAAAGGGKRVGGVAAAAAASALGAVDFRRGREQRREKI